VLKAVPLGKKALGSFGSPERLMGELKTVCCFRKTWPFDFLEALNI